jgi:hypothetical protein
MYTLYLDKNEDFIAEISVKNASLKESKARLIVESPDGPNFIFNGKIENGKCIIPIRRLRGLLDEDVIGKMLLEIIVENTYFSPWHDDYKTTQHTSVKVTVNEQKISSKPSVTVKIPQKTAIQKLPKSHMVPIMELTNLCKKFGFTRRNILQHKTAFHQLICEYFKSNQEFLPHKKSVLEMVRYLLK